MRADGDWVVLEGVECRAFRLLLQRLLRDVGPLSAERETWKEVPGLQDDSKGAVSAAALRTLSTFMLMRRLRPQDPQIVLLEDAVERTKILRSPEAPISSKGVEARMVIPQANGKALIAGIARPMPRFRLTSATLKE